MIFAGILLGFVSFISLATLYHKMPEWLKRFCSKHNLLTDVATTVFTYLTLGSLSSSVTSALAAGIVGILFEVYMHFEKARTGSHGSRSVRT
jgi:hypothetical protein